MFSNFGTKRTVHRWEVSAVLCSKISLGRLMLWTCEIQDTQCTIFMQKLKESSQIEHTSQDSISEFIIRKLNALVVVDFRFISAFLHVQWAVNSHARELQNFYQLIFLSLMLMSFKKFNPFKDFQADQIQRSFCKILTAHYACRNADLNLTLVMGTANGCIFK